VISEEVNQNYSENVRLVLVEHAIININSTLQRIEKTSSEDRSESRSYFRWTMGFIGGLYLMLGSAFITVIIKFVH